MCKAVWEIWWSIKLVVIPSSLYSSMVTRHEKIDNTGDKWFTAIIEDVSWEETLLFDKWMVQTSVLGVAGR